MIETWLMRMAAVALAVAGFYFWADHRGYERSEKKHADALEQQRAENQTKMDNLRTDYDALTELKDEEIKRTAAERDRIAASLRNRPERMSETAQAACQGGTGAGLSRPDGEFLVGEATRANELRAQLSACQDREWKSYEALTIKAP
jgi:hypothetical protein